MTLLELLLLMSIVAVLLASTLSSFRQMIMNNRRTVAINELVGTIQARRMASSTNGLVTSNRRARSEAVKRRVPVTLCTSSNPLAATPACNAGGNIAGRIVFVDDADIVGNGQPDGNITIEPGEIILEAHAALPAQLTVSSNAAYISFTTNGFRHNGPLGPAATMIFSCE